MLAGGIDLNLNKWGRTMMEQVKALNTTDIDPAKSCCPFDKKRVGTVLSDGGALIVLECLDHALARGAHIYCEMTGFA